MTIRRVFGFTLDISKSVHANAERILDDEPKNINKIQQRNFTFHNLCPPQIKLPVGLGALLGLGLKFCIERPRPYQDICTNLQRLRKSINIRNYLVKEGLNKPTPGFNRRLYVNSRSNMPDSDNPFANAVQRFEDTVNELRHALPTYRRFNLRPLHRRALSSFSTLGLICHPADKGVGPYVAPRGKYFHQGYTEHLSNKYNYVQLTAEEAKTELSSQKTAFLALFSEFRDSLDDEFIKYFKRSFESDRLSECRIPMLYLLWKVHKDVPAVRPVIACCGSFPEIFSIFLDECLKRLVQDVLTTYIISVDQLVYTLTTLFPGQLPLGAMLFSVDAIGMYGNIDTAHGIWVTKRFMELYGDRIKDFNIPFDFVCKCLVLIMKRNIFRFGDTFWRQKNGTAMGTSCAVNYAFLYMGLLEMLELLRDFKLWMPFYGRFIDDGIGIWLTLAPGADRAWVDFKRRLNSWGKLRWTNTGHVKSLVFLDLTITINSKRCLEFKTFRKKSNLHLYLPPNSAHPPDTIRSIIFSRVRAYFLHNTHYADLRAECVTLARDLIKSGWKWEDLSLHFHEAQGNLEKQGRYNMLKKAMKNRREKDAEKPVEQLIVFKLQYHPRGITRQQISLAWKSSGLAELLPERRFICAQLRPPNLRDRICSTSLKDLPGDNPSDYLNTNP